MSNQNQQPTKSPSVAQMVCRSLDKHRAALRAYRDGKPLVSPTCPSNAFPYEMRRAQSAAAKLSEWGCVEGGALTERGRELVAAIEAKWGSL
jgi:hypothetical protein